MTEVIARRCEDYEHCEVAGDYFVTEADELGVRRLQFLCSCGCCSLCGVRIRDDGRNVDGAWGWNMDMDKPTMTPSIAINGGHWHGYLTDGIFRSC